MEMGGFCELLKKDTLRESSNQLHVLFLNRRVIVTDYFANRPWEDTQLSLINVFIMDAWF